MKVRERYSSYSSNHSEAPLRSRTQLERTCEYLDAEIDTLVYQLYGLTEEEIGIVEGVI